MVTMKTNIVVVVFYFVIACKGKHSDNSVTGGIGPFRIADTTDKMIKIFRDRGKAYLSTRDYNEASEYYTAVLQLLEEGDGEAHRQLRRTCTLTLAECEIKNGRFQEAIARCTEVILEYPSVLDGIDRDNVTQKAVAKAYYRRGVSLNLLGRPELALLDLKAAERESPDVDKLIVAQISSIRAYINGVNNSSTVEKIQADPGLVDELQDILDNAQLNHPKSHISHRRIQAMLSDHRSSIRGLVANPFSDDSLGLENLFTSLRQESGDISGRGISGLHSPLQHLATGTNDLGGGGLGGLMSGAAGGLSSGGLGGLLSLASQLGGINPKIITEVKDIATALISVYSKFRQIHSWLVSHNEQMMLVITILWIAKFISTHSR